MTDDGGDPGGGSPAEMSRLARLRREKHDDLSLCSYRLEQCLSWAATEWRAEAASALCRAGEVLLAEIGTVLTAIERQGVALEAYGAEVGDIAAAQRVLERRRGEVEEALEWTIRSMVLLEAEEAASGGGRWSPLDEVRAFELEALERGEQVNHTVLAHIGREWAELVTRRQAADSGCMSALCGDAATGAFVDFSQAARDATTPEQVLRLMDGPSAFDLALLFADAPLLTALVAEATPEAVRRWWDALALLRPVDAAGLSAAQQALVLGVPWLVGNLDGVPPAARVRANAVTAARQVVENLKVIDDIARPPSDEPRAREAILELERENVYLRGAATVPPTVQLYTYDRAADRIVEMLGDWSGTVERVYTDVPGARTRMDDFWTHGGGVQGFVRRLVRDDEVDSVAFVYKDGHFPGAGDAASPAEAASPSFARRSGEQLAAFRAGLAAGTASSGAAPPRSVGVGHGWGTANVLASETAGARWDHVVVLAGVGAEHDLAGARGAERDSSRRPTEFGRYGSESEAARALRWSSPLEERTAASVWRHALVSSGRDRSEQVLRDVISDLVTVGPR
ncbi:hypothetical protein ES689_06215 [Frigoribacterium sp. ACAM 257]|uniref:hypothetical protein n=1 Tax=Frigoribacterium sp. ACAM 257 TaxID=2508998 RepID=UPI0011B9BFFE|nr:hypothetical protein [Frigoribacterium sp. ACAM 257]TWX40978.1 hypothetical protein ES689_06215 [Frigoribacterium sp. ACAM 257]